MRIRAVLLPFALATTLALAGCADDETGLLSPSAPADPTTPASASADPSAAPAFPVTVRSHFGEVTIPERAERVVTIGFNEQDFALALGVVPVGVRAFEGGFDWRNRSWAQEGLGGQDLPEVGGFELNIEAVAALDPDLILGTYSFLTQTQCDQLSQIAPTVGDLVDPESGEALTWQQQLETIGQALGESERAAALQDEVESTFADVRARHPEFAGKTLAVYFSTEEGGFLLEGSDPRQHFFTELGFEVPDTVGPISDEQLSLLDQDVLVYAGQSREEALDRAVLARLAVVTEDRTLFVGGFSEPFLGALGFASPLSLPAAIDMILPDLIAATDGDEGTTVRETAAATSG